MVRMGATGLPPGFISGRRHAFGQPERRPQLPQYGALAACEVDSRFELRACGGGFADGQKRLSKVPAQLRREP